MKKPQLERNPISCYFLETKSCLHTLRVILKPLTLIFSAECQPWMGCPEKVSAHQIFLSVAVPDPNWITGRQIKQSKWNIEIPHGNLRAAEYCLGEFLIDGSAIKP